MLQELMTLLAILNLTTQVGGMRTVTGGEVCHCGCGAASESRFRI